MVVPVQESVCMASGSLFPADYWKRPRIDPKKIGDAGPVGIHLAVGVALSSWEALEENLQQLFITLSDPKDPKARFLLQGVFGVVENSATRVSMSRVAARLRYAHHWQDPRVSGPITSLLNDVNHASHRRNEIAHCRINNYHVQTPTDQEGSDTSSVGFFLMAPSYLVTRNREMYSQEDKDDPIGWTTSLYRYNSVDILTLAGKFSELSNKVYEYIVESSLNRFGIPKNVYNIEQESFGFSPQNE